MPRYTMQDGASIHTRDAAQSWKEATFWDGKDIISRATGSQRLHQTLYKTREGRYYLIHTSEIADSHATWLSSQQAAQWLVLNERYLPDDLVHYAGELP